MTASTAITTRIDHYYTVRFPARMDAIGDAPDFLDKRGGRTPYASRAMRFYDPDRAAIVAESIGGSVTEHWSR